MRRRPEPGPTREAVRKLEKMVDEADGIISQRSGEILRLQSLLSLLHEGIVHIEADEIAAGEHEWPEWFEGRLRRVERYLQRITDQANALSGGMSYETKAALAILIKEVKDLIQPASAALPVGMKRDLEHLLDGWVGQNHLPVQFVRSIKVPAGQKLVRTEHGPGGILVPITEPTGEHGKLHSDSKEDAYTDRNLAVIALARLAQRIGLEVGMRQSDDLKWPFLYIVLPTGQVSWQMPSDVLPKGSFPEFAPGWDRHDLATKQARLRVFGSDPDVLDLPDDRFIPPGGRRGRR